MDKEYKNVFKKEGWFIILIKNLNVRNYSLYFYINWLI